MAHWYHRNPLKATSPVTFDQRAVCTTPQAQKICNDLKQTRIRLLEVVSNPNNEVETLNKAAIDYLALLEGFIKPFDEKTGDSKLRFSIKFRWTNTLLGYTPTEQQDARYEKMSMFFNVALWYTKHASKLAGKDEPSMEEAKEVHKCLRLAAGVFSYIRDQLVGTLITPPEKAEDLEARVITAYVHQCTAEAQEVTIARAIELKHSASIISALANETAKMFTAADDQLNTLEDKEVGKWRKYLQFKIAIYLAYAYNYHGETLLAQDQCGIAIKCLQESMTQYEKASTLAREYSTTKGPGTTCKPTEHLFFRKLGPVVKRTLEKCVRENGFIYHHKVPAEPPELEIKATYGLVAPEEFPVPPPSPLWTPEAYAAFDISKAPVKDPKKDKKDPKQEGDIAPVKEADIPQSKKDPKNSSGCVIS